MAETALRDEYEYYLEHQAVITNTNTWIRCSCTFTVSS